MEQKLATEVHQTAVSKGWWSDLEDVLSQNGDNVTVSRELFTRMFLICKLALISTEVHEAIEELRETKVDWFSRNAKLKPIGFLSEIVDIDIRLNDFIEALKFFHQIDYNNILKIKAKFNKSRPYKHGKIL